MHSFSKILGKSGIQISAMGMGCWPIGGSFYSDGKNLGYGKVDDKESIKALQAAVSCGVNFFDTSDVYGAGHSESLMGKAFGKKREKVVIATKFGNVVDPESKSIIGQDVSKTGIIEACEASLKRLKTDYIDLYQNHIWSIGESEVEGVIEGLETLKKDGKIRAYGWSSGDIGLQKKFIQNSATDSIQHPYNLFDGNRDVVALCEENRLSSINNLPLAMGLLSGKYNKGIKLGLGDIRGEGIDWIPYFKDGAAAITYRDNLEKIRSLLTVGGRTLVQGAIGWLWANSPTNIPIPGFKSVSQVEENTKALDYGPLPEDVMNQIEIVLGRDKE